MKKIIYLFVILILGFCLSTGGFVLARETPAESEANLNCVKGDKILDYYEKLEDKSNGDRYLNAAKYFYYQATRLDLSNQNALIGHARVALYQNRLRDAKNALMMALNFNEVNPRVSYYLGEVFFREGEYTQAIDFYNWAYTHGYKYDYNTNYKLGICYEKLDDVKNAKYHYKNAIKVNPGSVEAKARLGGLDVVSENYKKHEDYKQQEEAEEEPISPEDIKNLNMN